jgi:hypothetical protein
MVSKNVHYFCVNTIFLDDEDFGVVYSSGIFDQTGGPEFYAADVPRDKEHPLRLLMDSLSNCVIHDNEIYESGGILVKLEELVGKERKIVLEQCMYRANTNARVFQLRPLFLETEGSVRAWGRYPPAPQGKDKMAQSIIKKFRSGSFVRHFDGKVSNIAQDNTESVNIVDVMRNMHWAVDWEKHVTKDEVSYISQNHTYFEQVFAARRNLIQHE